MITNLKFLNEFCNGNNDRVKKYISMYLKSTPGNIEKIEAALIAEDYPLLKIVVHSMKPHLNFMGMTKTRETAETIEAIIVSGKGLENLSMFVQSLIYDCKTSLSELS